MIKVSTVNTVSFEKKIQKIVGSIHSYKEEAAIWRIGNKAINKRGLLYRANQKWFRHSKLALKHLINPAKNLKITNSPYAYQHIVYIDLDTKNGLGSKSDVLKLNDFLVQNFFPEMGLPEINARGGCNWLIVDVWTRLRPGYISRVPAEEWNRTLAAFGLALQKLSRHLNCTFSEVDAYGSLPVLISKGNEIVDVKTDNKLLFKCPYGDPNISQTISYTRLKEVIAAIESLVVSSGSIGSVSPTVEKAKSPGSSFEHAEERIEAIRKVVMVDCTRPIEVHCGKKKRNITARMLAEYIYAISLLKKNADGSMPHRRIGAFISMFFQRGVFAHGYDPSILTTVRNWMSSKGMIAWEDNTYSQGRACKWEVKKDVRNAVKSMDICSSSYFVSTNISTDFIKPKWKEEKPIVDGWQEYIETFAWEESGF